MPMPDDFTSANMPPHYRMSAADRAKLERIEQYEDLSDGVRVFRDKLEVLVSTLRTGAQSNTAWAADLGDRLCTVLDEADGFCALVIGDGGNIDRAIELLSNQSTARDRARELAE